MRMKKPFVALATAAMMTLAACGGSGSGGGDDEIERQGEGGGAGAGKDATAEGPVEVPSDAQEGGTFTVPTNQAPSTLDPTRAYYTDSTAIMSLVTRSLTQYRFNPDTKDMELVPDMATDLGQPNEDNTEWTFELKDGLKYENGDPVKAEDVAYAIKRSFAITELPDGPTYNTSFFLDGDKYKGPYATEAELKKRADYEEGQYAGEDYKGVTVEGNKITIKMATPFAEMDYYASFPQFTAIPKSADKNPTAYGNKPLATGPYKFEDYKPGAQLTLVANDQWDPASDPGRIQAVDKFLFKFSQETAKFEGDMVNDADPTSFSYDNVTPGTYRKLKADDRVVAGTSPCTFMWFLDMTKIKDKKVREALNWAYPYQATWKAGGEVPDLTRVAGTSILPPGTAGRKEYQPVEGQDGQTTDPEKSKALLKEAGAENFEIKFLYARDDDLAVAAKDQTVKGLEAGGFKATPIASTTESIRDERTDADGEQNIRSSGWCSDWPTGGSWFPAIMDGDLVGVEGMPNQSNLKEEPVDTEIDRILNEVPAEDQAAAWGDLDEMIGTEYLPMVNIGYSGTAIGRGSKVGGMYNDTVRGMPTLATMYITK